MNLTTNSSVSTEDFSPLQPLVTAVMITGKSPDRRELALAAVRDFQAQTYPRRELLAINDSGAPWFSDVLTVREIVLQRQASLGELRNVATNNALGDLIIQWDDDDRYRNDRIAVQVAHWRPGIANVLRRQIRRDIVTGEQHTVDHPKHGIDGTILYERRNAPKYPPQARSEDTVFRNKFEGRIVVVDNDPEMCKASQTSGSQRHNVKRTRNNNAPRCTVAKYAAD